MVSWLFGSRIRIAATLITALLALVALTLAAFPWGILKGTLEDRMTARFGRPVTIGAMERVDHFGFATTVQLRDVILPGPDWAGKQDLARVARMQIGFNSLSLLSGRLALHDVSIDGARLYLFRAADGRESWQGTTGRGGKGGGGLQDLVVRQSQLTYVDEKRDRRFDLRVASDPKIGLRVRGDGTIRDTPVRVAAQGPAISSVNEGKWPFDVRLAGRELTMHVKGVMAAPLDTQHMSLEVTAEASDLKLVDAIIEAGLFRTQPVSLSASVRREPDKWLVDRLSGRIGRSDLSGKLSLNKEGERTKLDGSLESRQLDFDDLSSDEGLRRGAAKKAAIGPRIVPDTRINLAKIGKTDARLRFKVARIVSRHGPSTITSLAGALTLDNRVLTVSPLTIGLREGRITGRAVVDQGNNRPVPLLRLDLRLSDSSIPALAGGGGSVSGRVDARAQLAGRGSTIRQAVGNADGRIGLAARRGALPKEIAEALGFDAGGALLSGSDDRAVLRCVIVGADLRGGRGRVGPFVVDTSQSRLDGQGTITFPDERLAIRLTGAPKHDAVLRLPGAATMSGTISEPDIVVPREVKSVGNVLKALGRAITGKQGPVAQDADCGALARQVLR